MHETDAMQFIESVLLGFLSRNFDYREGEEPSRYEPHLKKIQLFIRDTEPYWVKEKSFYIVEDIEYAEISIHTGRYTPTSPETFVDTILNRARERIEDLSKRYRLEQNPVKMSVFVSLPSFPRKK